MRLVLKLTIDLERTRPREAEAPTVIESQGSLVETMPQPRYVGFEAVDHD